MAGKTWFLGILTWTLFLSQFPTPAQTRGPSSPWIRPGKEKILDLKFFRGTPREKARLLRQGFLVTSNRAPSMAVLYRVLPARVVLVTPDAFLDPLMEVFYDLRRLSWDRSTKALPQVLREWTARLAPFRNGPWSEEALLGEKILRVCLGVLQGAAQADFKDAAAEIGLIRGGAGPAPSPLMGRIIDYGIMQELWEEKGPAGASWRRLAAMKAWLGRIPLLLASPRETRTALLLAATAPRGWKEYRKEEKAFEGPLDNLDLDAYARALKEAGGIGKVMASRSAFLQARKILDSLPGPRVADPSLVRVNPLITGKTYEEIRRGQKGLVLDGAGWAPGAEILSRGAPIGASVHPSALWIAWAGGNEEARRAWRTYELAFPTGTPWAPGPARTEAVEWEKIKSIMARTSSLPPSAHSLFWKLFFALDRRDPARDPNPEWFWHTPAWARRRMITALAAWTLWRRAMGPGLRLGYGLIGCLGGEPSGYVAATLPELEGLGGFAEFLRSRTLRGSWSEKVLEKLSSWIDRMKALRRKQTKGIPWTAEERKYFSDFWMALVPSPGLVSDIIGGTPHAFTVPVARLTDLRKDSAPRPQVTLYAATACPRILYALVRCGKRWRLAAGGLLDFREFVHPSGVPMNDSSWRRILESRPEAGKIAGHASAKKKTKKDPLEEAFSSRNALLLLTEIEAKGMGDKKTALLLAEFLARARKGVRRKKRLVLSSALEKLGGIPALAAALEVLWTGEVKLDPLPGKDWEKTARAIVRASLREGLSCNDFLEHYLAKDPETAKEVIRGYIHMRRRWNTSDMSFFLSRFLGWPPLTEIELFPRPEREELAEEVIRKWNPKLEKDRPLFTWDILNLFLSGAPSGVKAVEDYFATHPRIIPSLIPDLWFKSKGLFPKAAMAWMRGKLDSPPGTPSLYLFCAGILGTYGVEMKNSWFEKAWRCWIPYLEGKRKEKLSYDWSEMGLHCLLIAAPRRTLQALAKRYREASPSEKRKLKESLRARVEGWREKLEKTAGLPRPAKPPHGAFLEDPASRKALAAWLTGVRETLAHFKKVQ